MNFHLIEDMAETGKLGITELRQLEVSPWDLPLTNLRGVIRKTSRFWWLPREDKTIGVLPESLRDVLYEECVVHGCSRCEKERACVAFTERHGYPLKEFVVRNANSYEDYYENVRGKKYGK